MQDSVAQLVEQLTLNQWVESSSLSGVTQAGNLSISGLLFWVGRTLGRAGGLGEAIYLSGVGCRQSVNFILIPYLGLTLSNILFGNYWTNFHDIIFK